MKTFIATAVDASAVQQALSGLRTPVPLNHIPRDEQVLFQSNILGPVRILITANLDLISVLLDARSTSLSLRGDFDVFLCGKTPNFIQFTLFIPPTQTTNLISAHSLSRNLSTSCRKNLTFPSEIMSSPTCHALISDQ